MTRYSTEYGAYIIEPMPSQPQIAICHGLFVHREMRGSGMGHELKLHQERTLVNDLYDYGVCSCDGANVAQQRVLAVAGWRRLDEFENGKTGGRTQIWGRPVSEMRAELTAPI